MPCNVYRWLQKHVAWWEVHEFCLTLLDLLAFFRRTTCSNRTINLECCDWRSMTCLRRRRPEICWMLVGIVMSYVELEVKVSDDVRCTHAPQDHLCKFFLRRWQDIVNEWNILKWFHEFLRFGGPDRDSRFIHVQSMDCFSWKMPFRLVFQPQTWLFGSHIFSRNLTWLFWTNLATTYPMHF